MKFISFHHNNRHGFGALDGHDGVIDLSARCGQVDLGDALRKMGANTLRDLASRHSADFPLTDVQAYRPVVADPAQIFCAGLNYEDHRIESNRQRTGQPTIFLRLPASQTGHDQPLLLPPETERFDYEGEIAVVIGEGGRRIKSEHAFKHILGFSAYNDGSVRDWQSHTTQWIPGKNFPQTGAFGPTLVLTDEISDSDVLKVETHLNGECMQSATTDMMLFPIPELVAYISTFIPLMPGDVIVTGTPGGVGSKRTPPAYMRENDVVEISVSGVGTLRNTVQREKNLA